VPTKPNRRADPDIQPEYDLSKGRRGVYFDQACLGIRIDRAEEETRRDDGHPEAKRGRRPDE